nr:putative ribonuclease H-like domain-containing protein [Tanacetum cinerariifolium]
GGVVTAVVFRWRGGSGGGSTVVAAGRVRESGINERIDRETSNLFGFDGKIPPEKFSGGGRRRRVVAGRQEAAAGGGEWGEKRENFIGYAVTSSGWPFVSIVPGQMTHFVASLTLDSTSWGGSVSPEGFLPSILLLLMIIVVAAIVFTVILVVVVGYGNGFLQSLRIFSGNISFNTPGRISLEELFSQQEKMELESTQISTTAKLPMLKQGDYKMWRLRIEQYFQVQDYALWDVIEIGNSFKPVAQTTTNDAGEFISQEDLNLKFLRRLPFEWNTHVVDKRAASSNSSSKNMAFVSSPSTNSTNEVYTTYGVGTASTQSSTASTPVSIAGSQTSNANLPSTIKHESKEVFHGKKITINGSNTAGFNMSKVECYNCHKMGHFARKCKGPRNQDSRNMYQDNSRRTVNVEETPSKAMVAINGVGFDWSNIAEDEVPTNMALMDFSDSKSLDKLIGSQITYNSKKGLGYESYHAIPPLPTWLFLPPKLDLSNSGLEEFKQPEFESYGPKSGRIESKNASEDIPNELKEYHDAPLVKDGVSKNKDCLVELTAITIKGKGLYQGILTRVNYNNSTRKTHPNAHWDMAPRVVLMKTGLRLLNTARHVNTAHPKTTVYSARPMPIAVNTARPRAVNTARPNSSVVNAVRANQVNVVKASECNMSYLSDFKKFDRGYVTFGRGTNGGRITGKETLKTGKLDFVEVYFVNELKFNLLLVSQMCDKKNSVLFTDTKCFVLSPDFKLTNESRVLLKVPRRNNMYSVDMKNIILKESLTCLVAKTTLDESMLWHKRLGHINFKNINKLVKDNILEVDPKNVLKMTKLVLIV